MRKINFLKILLMEVLESILRNLRKLFIKFDERTCYPGIKTEGFVIIENFMSDRECDHYKELIDNFIKTKHDLVWRDETKSDERIYFSNQYISEFDGIFRDPFIRKALRGHTGCLNPVGFVLANKISFVDNNAGSGGGWHRDSLINHQFKAILYLSDVTASNGPFQYIRSSNTKRSLFNNFIKGDSIFGKHRFSNNEIDNYLKRLPERDLVTITGRKGTLLLVDTKGIHRGSPLIQGNRYALTTYFWDQRIPKHVANMHPRFN